MKLKTYIAAFHAALFAILLGVSPAGSGSLSLLGVGKASGSAPATTTTWNPSDKSVDFNLSGSDLVATYIGSSGFRSIRAIASHLTGKYYYEAVVNENTSGFCFPGMGNAAASLSNFAGSDNNSVGWVVGSGNVFLGGTGIATIQTAAVGDTLGILFDLTATPKVGFFRTYHAGAWGDWNNDPTANPATGVGGIDISNLAAGPYFPMATGNASPNQITANFGGSAYGQTPPAGAGNW